MTEATLAFQVDESRCMRCGLCVADCLAGIITLEGSGFPTIAAERESSCIDCQHCLAICPDGALAIHGHRPEASLPVSRGAMPDLAQMDLLVRARRSVRQYRDRNVDPELIQRLLQTLEHAPTGVNCRQLSFAVIEDKAVLARFRTRVMAGLMQAMDGGQLPDATGYLTRMLGQWRDQGRDVIFRGAPHLLVVSAPPGTPTPRQDVVLTLATFEFLAQSAGLGTLWVGLVVRALELLPDLKPLLGLPQDHVYYAMLFGHPAVHYARTVQRQGSARIHRVALPD